MSIHFHNFAVEGVFALILLFGALSDISKIFGWVRRYILKRPPVGFHVLTEQEEDHQLRRAMIEALRAGELHKAREIKTFIKPRGSDAK